MADIRKSLITASDGKNYFTTATDGKKYEDTFYSLEIEKSKWEVNLFQLTTK